MLEAALLLLFCFLVGLLFLAVSVWVVLSGQLFSLDGLLMASVSLLLGGLFMANFAWSVRTGEVREVLKYIRSRWARKAD